jgi:hypothetical protein
MPYKLEDAASIIGLERKVDSITKSLSRPYFCKILKELLKADTTNTEIIHITLLPEVDNNRHKNEEECIESS